MLIVMPIVLELLIVPTYEGKAAEAILSSQVQ
jgi:hypothetical protein